MVRHRCARLLFWLLSASPTTGRVVYISSGHDAPSCGQSPSAACASLGFALTHIVVANDEVELASGTYTETGPTIVFGSTTDSQNLTIRSSTNDASDVTIDRAYQGRLFDFTGVVSNWFVIISGIRFYRGGWTVAAPDKDYAGALMRLGAANAQIRFDRCQFEANVNPTSGHAGRGGVGVIIAGSPTFSDCSFHNNWGGIAGTFFIGNTASPQFDNCIFENSGCHDNGWGGVLVPEDESRGVWRRCVFRNNTCNYGGAVDDGGTASPLFVECLFENNFGRNMGGAYYGLGGSASQFKDCRFFGNRVAKGGNGQDFYLSSSSAPIFTDTFFDSGPNPVTIADGGAGCAKDNSVLTMRGCTITGYRASYGTIHLSVSANGTFHSCVFSNNKCVRGGGIATERPTLIQNCTFHGNEANEGGAIAMYGMVKDVQLIRIEDSYFEANVAGTSGGALRVSGPLRVETSRSRFVGNRATSRGGGAIYATSTGETIINQTTFIQNSSPSGGAIWSDGGSIVAVNSSFLENKLVTNTDAIDDSCGLLDGHAGGAIYTMRGSAMNMLEGSDGGGDAVYSGVCVMSDLHLHHLEFRSNAASDGGGGALFVDGQLPWCIDRVSQVCAECVFMGNTASYGYDVATAFNALVLLPTNAFPSRWTLMNPVDIVLGAMDRFGQRLAGSHAPLVVHVGVSSGGTSTNPLVKLVSNTSRILRNGAVTFKNVMLQMSPSIVANQVDREINITFTSEKPGFAGLSTTMTIPIVVSKCSQATGLLSPDGGCVLEATNSKQEFIVGIVVAAVSGVAFAFIIFWSYVHSDRVLETLHSFVTGIGGIVVRFTFEVVDIVSDIQALVNLFMYDLTISHPTMIRSMYLTLFALSIMPAIGVLRWSVHSMKAQWKRVLARKAILATTNKRRTLLSSFQRLLPRQGSTESQRVSSSSAVISGTKWMSKQFLEAFRSKRKLQIHATPTGPSMNAVLSSSTRSSATQATNKYDVPATFRFLDEQEKLLLVELEYQHIRTNYMKRALARLVSEDGLLLIFNVYIYLANKHEDRFTRSRFRSSLEMSILLSVLHLGSQVQNLVIWLQTNKVAEILEQLEKIRALRIAAVSNGNEFPTDS